MSDEGKIFRRRGKVVSYTDTRNKLRETHHETNSDV